MGVVEEIPPHDIWANQFIMIGIYLCLKSGRSVLGIAFGRLEIMCIGFQKRVYFGYCASQDGF